MLVFVVVNFNNVLNLNNYYNNILNLLYLKQVNKIYSMQTLLMKIFNNFRRRIKIDYVVEKT